MTRYRRRSEMVALIALMIGIGGLFSNPLSIQFTPLLAFGSFAITVMCTVLRLWVASAAWTLASVYGLSAVVPLYLPHVVAPRLGCNLTIVTFNMLENPPDEAGAARLLTRLHPDLLFAQKVYSPQRFRDRLLAMGFAGYSSFPAPDTPDLILARFPITRTGDDPTGIWAEIQVEGHQVTLKNMYATRPNHDWAGYVDYHRRLRDWVRAHPGPLILAGDANTTQFTPEIHALDGLVTDTWRERGLGLGFTFPAPWRRMGRLGPFLRIDYIFHNSAFDAAATRRIDDASGAGHYPVWAELVFAGIGRPGAKCD